MKRAASAAFFAALVVSTPIGADAPPDRYTIDAAAGLVTDRRTGLIWQHPANVSTYTWDQAASYCRGLRIGGSGGFRVPTLKELMTLIDPTRRNPAIDIAAFPNTPSEWFWTASNRASAGPAAVSFATGGSGFSRATDVLRVRCVR
jgi:Protein of unknown function (DUF1566)